MHNLLQSRNVIGSIAAFTAALSVFGLLRLFVGGESFWVNALVSIKVTILYQLWNLTTQNFVYLYVGPLEKIHHHVGFEGFQ
jgi:hypothetical protein